MKKLLKHVLFALPLLILFSGCPVGAQYPLGTPGKEKIDPSLIGTWVTKGEDPDFGKVTIKKKDDHSYAINVYEIGEMYSLEATEFTGWVTKIEGQTFIYSQPVGTDETDYYLYCYKTADNKTMKSHDVSLLVGGVDAITSTEAYREEVKASMGMEDFLTEETVWTKE